MTLLGAKRSTWVDQVVQTMEASVIRSDTRESWAQELGAVMGGLVLVSHRRGVAGPPRVVYLLDEAWCHDARRLRPEERALLADGDDDDAVLEVRGGRPAQRDGVACVGQVGTHVIHAMDLAKSGKVRREQRPEVI